MGLKKGQTNNLKGRPKGIPNKNTSVLPSFLDYLVDKGFDRFEEELNKLKGAEYVKAFLTIAKIMKHSRTDLRANEKLIEIFNKKINENGSIKQ
jgi:hypothetical protein